MTRASVTISEEPPNLRKDRTGAPDEAGQRPSWLRLQSVPQAGAVSLGRLPDCILLNGEMQSHPVRDGISPDLIDQTSTAP